MKLLGGIPNISPIWFNVKAVTTFSQGKRSKGTDVVKKEQKNSYRQDCPYFTID